MAKTFEAIISVLDKATAPMRGIETKAAVLHQRLSRLSETTGIARFTESVGELGDGLREAGSRALEFLEPLTAIAGIASAGGLVELVKATAEIGENMKLAAVATGMSADQISAWHYGAMLVNMDAGQFDHAIQRMNASIVDAAMGKNKEAENIITAMGFKNAPGHIVGTTTALRALAEETKYLISMGKSQRATDMLMKIFGGREGAELQPLLAGGAAGIDRMMAEAKKRGVVWSDAQAEQAEKAGEAFKNLKASIEGLEKAIAIDLFPKVTRLLHQASDWIDKNRTLISTKVDQFIERVAKAVGRIDFEKVADGINSTVTAMVKLLKLFSGDGSAMTGAMHLAELMGGIWLVKMLAPINKVIVRLGVMIAKMSMASAKALAGYGAAPEGAAAGAAGAPAAAAGAAVAADKMAAAGELALRVASRGAALRGGLAAASLWSMSADIDAQVDAMQRAAAKGPAALEKWQASQRQSFGERMFGWIPGLGGVDWNKSIADNIFGTSAPAPKAPAAAGVDAGTGTGVALKTPAPGAAPTRSILERPLPAPDRPLGPRSDITAPRQTETHVTLDFKNLPAGVRPQIESTGNPNVDMLFDWRYGYAMPQ